jgi:hypothetical protein
MRTKVKAVLPEVALTRILDALGEELIDASDEEIMEAAKDLGMDPHMKGSAAFLGLTFPTRMNVSDVFDLEAIKDIIARTERERAARGISTDPEPETPVLIGSRTSTDGKGPTQK